MADKKNKGLLPAAVFAAASIGFLYLVLQIPSTGPEYASADTDNCGNEVTAYVMAQNPVASLLKSPATASFPSYSSQGVEAVRSGECAFKVSAYVDAQNGFGAMVRTPFEASLTTDGKSWSVTNVLLSDG